MKETTGLVAHVEECINKAITETTSAFLSKLNEHQGQQKQLITNNSLTQQQMVEVRGDKTCLCLSVHQLYCDRR